MAYQLTTAKIWDGAAWVDATGGGIAYAGISATPTGTYTDGGVSYNYWEFTSNGSLVIDSDGLIDVLVVGGGAGGAATVYTDAASGGGGGIRNGLFEVTAGTHAVTVGAGGSSAYAASNAVSSNGSESSFGSFVKISGGRRAFAFNGSGSSYEQAGGGGAPGAISNDTNVSLRGAGFGSVTFGTNIWDGISLNYNGSTVEYSVGGLINTTAAATPNTGNGGNAHHSVGAAQGANGIVIVRIPA